MTKDAGFASPPAQSPRWYKKGQLVIFLRVRDGARSENFYNVTFFPDFGCAPLFFTDCHTIDLWFPPHPNQARFACLHDQKFQLLRTFFAFRRASNTVLRSLANHFPRQSTARFVSCGFKNVTNRYCECNDFVACSCLTHHRSVLFFRSIVYTIVQTGAPRPIV